MKKPDESSFIERFSKKLEIAGNYSEVWRIVKETVEFSLSKRNRSMMLFLDDLPIQLGAYHPIGTNNIVLNRTLVDIVDASLNSKPTVNALIYNLLLHEYLHALGEYSEGEVRRQVAVVAEKCFGKDHEATMIARKTPWVLLGKIPLEGINVPKRVMQIVTDFEETGKYIV